MPARPLRQWIVAGIVFLLLLGPLLAWVVQSWRMVVGCAGGLGNPGLAGELAGAACVLHDGRRRVAEIPLTEDVWITGMLALVLCCVLAAMVVPRWSAWSHRLTVLAVPLLFWTGLSIGSRGFQRRDGELSDYVAGSETSTGAVSGGWQVSSYRDRWIHLPDVDATWLLPAFFAGIALLVLVGLLWVDRAGRWCGSLVSASSRGCAVLDSETVIGLGGWEPRYARVLAIATNQGAGLAIVDSNGDAADIEAECFWQDKTGTWAPGTSTGPVSTGEIGVSAWGESGHLDPDSGAYLGYVRWACGRAPHSGPRTVTVAAWNLDIAVVAAEGGWWAWIEPIQAPAQTDTR